MTRLLKNYAVGQVLCKAEVIPWTNFFVPYMREMSTNSSKTIRAKSIAAHSSEAADPLHDAKQSIISNPHDVVSYPKLRGEMLEEKIVTKKIVEQLECTETKAIEILNVYPKLRSTHLDTFSKYLTFLKNNGITPTMFGENPWLLSGTLSTMRHRLEILKKIGVTDTTVLLLRIPTSRLEKTVAQWMSDREERENDFDNRLDFIAASLTCSVSEVAKLVTTKKHFFLLTLNYGRLQRTMKILLTCVTPEDIKSDLSIFEHGEEYLLKRTQLLVAAKVYPIKTWMLQTPLQTFLKNLEKMQSKSNIADENGIIGYLAHRLQCDEQYVRYMESRYPRLFQNDINKIEPVLDLLFDYGYSADQICVAPAVLNCTVNKLQTRLQELSKNGYNFNCICPLYAKESYYKEFLAEIRKKN